MLENEREYHLMHITQRQRKLAEELSKPGATIRDAMISSGYTEVSASRGIANVAERVIKLIAKKGIRLKELGEIDAATQEKLVRGRLVYNTIKGSDKGVLSAKALGSDRRVAMFAPESSVGIVVISAPTVAVEQKDKLLNED